MSKTGLLKENSTDDCFRESTHFRTVFFDSVSFFGRDFIYDSTQESIELAFYKPYLHPYTSYKFTTIKADVKITLK